MLKTPAALRKLAFTTWAATRRGLREEEDLAACPVVEHGIAPRHLLPFHDRHIHAQAVTAQGGLPRHGAFAQLFGRRPTVWREQQISR